MGTVPPFSELIAATASSAVHLEMRDAYTPDDQRFLDWLAGMPLSHPANPAWSQLVRTHAARGVRLAVRREAHPFLVFLRRRSLPGGRTGLGPDGRPDVLGSEVVPVIDSGNKGPREQHNYGAGTFIGRDNYGDVRYEMLDPKTKAVLAKLSKDAPDLAMLLRKALRDGVISPDVVAALESAVRNINQDVADALLIAGK